MISHLRVQSPWRQLGILLALLCGAVVFYLFVMVILIAATGNTPATNEFTIAQILASKKWLVAFDSIIIFLLPSLLFSRICFAEVPLHFLGWRRPQKAITYVFAVLCTLLAFPFLFWLVELSQLLPFPGWIKSIGKDNYLLETLLQTRSIADIFVNMLIIAILPAICEEFLFRGVLQRILTQICKSPWPGIVLTSVIFSAVHGDYEGFLSRLYLGLLLGMLYWYSGSLWPAILAHFLNNAVCVIAVAIFPESVKEDPHLPWYFGFISGLVITGLLMLYRKQSSMTYSSVYAVHPPNAMKVIETQTKM